MNKRKKSGSVVLLHAMTYLADLYMTRDMTVICRQSWSDYVAIRLIESLRDVCSITETLAVPVCGSGFNHEKRGS